MPPLGMVPPGQATTEQRACAPGVPEVPGQVNTAVGVTESAPAASGPSFEERLAKLESLKEKGLVSEEEYATTRKQILADI